VSKYLTFKTNKRILIEKEREIIMLERVKEIIEEQLNLENVEITEETRFKEDLEVDSLDLFELAMAFEEEYGIEIPSEELENITTVGAVIKYMQDKGVEA
jgi:acyl carrier protein